MRYYKVLNENYIIAVGVGVGNIEITEQEYDNLLSVIHNKPIAESGYDYRLNNNVEWEKYEIPPMPIEDEDASEADYLAALNELGVQ